MTWSTHKALGLRLGRPDTHAKNVVPGVIISNLFIRVSMNIYIKAYINVFSDVTHTEWGTHTNTNTSCSNTCISGIVWWAFNWHRLLSRYREGSIGQKVTSSENNVGNWPALKLYRKNCLGTECGDNSAPSRWLVLHFCFILFSCFLLSPHVLESFFSGMFSVPGWVRKSRHHPWWHECIYCLDTTLALT